MKDYVGKVCWQAFGYSSINFGVVISQKMEESGWLLVEVKWDRTEETTWEKILNVSFTMPIRKP